MSGLIKYVVRPSMRDEAFRVMLKTSPKSRVDHLQKLAYDVPLSYGRWLKYFDLQLAEKFLMPEDCEEIEVVEYNKVEQN